tara:strand:- start:367 stop:894 length:528 start_codon:yes stop_codon:yes gene_type:complete
MTRVKVKQMRRKQQRRNKVERLQKQEQLIRWQLLKDRKLADVTRRNFISDRVVECEDVLLDIGWLLEDEQDEQYEQEFWQGLERGYGDEDDWLYAWYPDDWSYHHYLDAVEWGDIPEDPLTNEHHYHKDGVFYPWGDYNAEMHLMDEGISKVLSPQQRAVLYGICDGTEQIRACA